MPANALVRLIYRSKAVTSGSQPKAADTLSAILSCAWANNPSHGITGVLLFDGAYFVQVLEGPSDEVEQLYEMIARDLRHESIELIDFLPIETREYASFPMEFKEIDGTRCPELQHLMCRGVQGSAAHLTTLISELVAAGV